MSVNGRLDNLESIVGSDWPGTDRGAARDAISTLVLNPDTVDYLRTAAVTEDCNLLLNSQIMERQTNVH
jgi:hypothetical protein